MAAACWAGERLGDGTAGWHRIHPATRPPFPAAAAGRAAGQARQISRLLSHLLLPQVSKEKLQAVVNQRAHMHCKTPDSKQLG